MPNKIIRLIKSSKSIVKLPIQAAIKKLGVNSSKDDAGGLCR